MAQQSFGGRPTQKQLDEWEAAVKEEAQRAAAVSRPVMEVSLVRTVKANVARVAGNVRRLAGPIFNLHNVEQNTLQDLMSGLDQDIALLIRVRHMEGTGIPGAWVALKNAYANGNGSCQACRAPADQLSAMLQQVDE